MRNSKHFGVRRTVLNSDVPFKKYFITCEGQETEVLYFNEIKKNRDDLNIKKDIEFIFLERNGLHRRWSHPKKIFEIIKPIMDNLTNSQTTIKTLIESIVDYCYSFSKIINTKKDCDELRNFLRKYFIDRNNYKEEDLIKYDSSLIKILIFKLKSLLQEDLFKNQLEPFIKSQFSTYDPELDEVCLVVDRDRDNFFEDQFIELLKNCEENNFKLYITNPCFEFWLLMHFDEVFKINHDKLLENKKCQIVDKKGNNKELTYSEAKLREIIPEYRKNNLCFGEFKNKLVIAIENSKKFETNICNLKDEIGSNICALFEELIENK